MGLFDDHWKSDYKSSKKQATEKDAPPISSSSSDQDTGMNLFGDYPFDTEKTKSPTKKVLAEKKA